MSLKAAIESNASFLQLNKLRFSVLTENNIAVKRSLESVSNTVARLSCCPNGFCRIVYCKKCNQWYYTHSCICWVCRNETGVQVLYKGCDSKKCPCFGDEEAVRKLWETTKEELYCGHKARTPVEKELLIGLTLTIIGNIVANNWISELIDTRRSVIRIKISTLDETKVITPVCSLNNMQNLNVLGEMELVDILKAYYSKVKTPQEMSMAPIQFLKNMMADGSIEILLKSLKITDEVKIASYRVKYQHSLLSQKQKITLGETVKEDMLEECPDGWIIVDEDNITHTDNKLDGEDDELKSGDEVSSEQQKVLNSNERMKAKQRKIREKKKKEDVIMMDTIM